MANTLWKHAGMTHDPAKRKVVCPRCGTPYEVAPSTAITCDNGRACQAAIQVPA